MENLSIHASVSLNSHQLLMKASLPTESTSTNYTESKNQNPMQDSSDQKSYCLNDNTITNTNDLLSEQETGN